MASIDIFADKVALTLFEQHGRSAMVHVEEQVKVAVKKADWAAVTSWRHVGSEVEKLCRLRKPCGPPKEAQAISRDEAARSTTSRRPARRA